VTRLALQAAGVRKAKRRRAHRKKRPRRPLPGMLLMHDGSTHRWIPGLDRDLDLIVTLDDATGALYSAWACGRRLRGMACLERFTPIGAATTSKPARPAARSTTSI